MFPFVVLGGFLPDGAKISTKAEYENSNAVVLTFLVDNYDGKSDDPIVIRKLERAKAWEKEFVRFMLEWTSNPNNTQYMDVAFNSERSIEDELDRETYGDIMTIAVSYIFMFIYITFSLGKISKLSRFAIESKVSTYLFKIIRSHSKSLEVLIEQIYLECFFQYFQITLGLG